MTSGGRHGGIGLTFVAAFLAGAGFFLVVGAKPGTGEEPAKIAKALEQFTKLHRELARAIDRAGRGESIESH
jgi:hypothetical protein